MSCSWNQEAFHDQLAPLQTPNRGPDPSLTVRRQHFCSASCQGRPSLHQVRGGNFLEQQHQRTRKRQEQQQQRARRGLRSCRSGQSGLGEAEAKLQCRRERLRTARPVPNLVLSTSAEGKVKLSKIVFLQSKAFLFLETCAFWPSRVWLC